MIRWRTVLALTVSGCCLYSGIAAAGAIESSYRTARKVIEGAMQHTGVGEWLARPVPVLIKAQGTFYQGAEHQGRAPGDPTPARFWETWAFDPSSGAVGREYRHLRPDGTTEWLREIYPGGDEQLLINMAAGWAIRLKGGGFDFGRDRNLRRFPPLLLKEAMQYPESLRSMGRYGPFNSVQAQTRSQEGLSLFFGRESQTLSWVEYLIDLPTFADSTVSWKFTDYRMVEGVGKLPWRYGVHVNEAPLTDMEVLYVSTDPEKVGHFLSLPTDMPEPETRVLAGQASPTDRAKLKEVGDGVFSIFNLRTGFHTLFVEFDTYLLAVDAPAGYPLLNELPAGDVVPGLGENALSEHAIRMVRKRVGDKPLKYLALTHFHSDHAGGLFAYGEENVNLLVAASEMEAVSTFLGSTHTLCELDSSRAEFTLQPVRGRKVIFDGSQKVELLDVGSNPHTDHMLVVWLPGQEILYVADLLTGRDGRPDEQHAKLNEFFLEWVKKRRLKPKLILTSHGDGAVWYPVPEGESNETLISPKEP